MSEFTIVNIDSIKEDTVSIECYLVSADGVLKYDFNDDTDELPMLKATGLTLLISLIENYSDEFNNPLLSEVSTPSEAYTLSGEKLNSIIKSATISAFNLDFDIDILDDSDHPLTPKASEIGDGWDIYNKSILNKEYVKHLPMVSISMTFSSVELLKNIPVGIWNWSAYDTNLDWL
ncbi:hypothetical protein [Spirochaeta cellobiosiphila]|uniref:hypothetical protein n=1 Tax=Spirochaeta cellobiosiphila TaxID=504483 RepID=UPI00040EC7B3|nr:hypothetical protein [Spirochaeta cellobiosiphila]